MCTQFIDIMQAYGLLSSKMNLLPYLPSIHVKMLIAANM